MIRPFSGQGFRGINYDPEAQKGQIITFKQFTSTSIKKETALSFAAKSKNTEKCLF